MWTTNHSVYLKEVAERCASREVMHLNTHRRLARQCACFKLPTIFISLICGSAQASQESLDRLINSPSFTPWLPIILGLLSLFVSLLNSVSSYLQVESLCQRHLTSSIMFGKLCRQISKEVRLAPKDRTLGGSEAIKQYGMQFDQLLEQAPPLCRRVEKAFSQRRDARKLNLTVPPSIRIAPITLYKPTGLQRSAGRVDVGVDDSNPGTVRELTDMFDA
tara:strand:- start:10 stop:666 length:657 start_codon:yes stop_codon:yes gene_type:complete